VQRLGEAADGELRGVVGSLLRHRDEPEDAGEVGQLAVPAADQVRQERLRPVDDAPEVDLHEPAHVVVLELAHQPVQRDARRC
jgi:hypothetical protein